MSTNDVTREYINVNQWRHTWIYKCQQVTSHLIVNSAWKWTRRYYLYPLKLLQLWCDFFSILPHYSGLDNFIALFNIYINRTIFRFSVLFSISLKQTTHLPYCLDLLTHLMEVGNRLYFLWILILSFKRTPSLDRRKHIFTLSFAGDVWRGIFESEYAEIMELFPVNPKTVGKRYQIPTNQKSLKLFYMYSLHSKQGCNWRLDGFSQFSPKPFLCLELGVVAGRNVVQYFWHVAIFNANRNDLLLYSSC